MTTIIGTFEIVERREGGFDVVDRDTFNNWGLRTAEPTRECAEVYAQWAHAFKTGRTFSSLAAYAAARNVHCN